MKRFILISGTVVFVVLVAGLISVLLSLNGIVKKSVETVGPMVTKVSVTLGAADISPFSGSGKLTDFVVGNPPGCKSAHAMEVSQMALAVEPKSLMSDVMVIHEITVKEAKITMEGGLTDNNLTKILANVKEFADNLPGADKTKPSEEQKKSQKKMIINEFLIEGAQVTMVLNLPVLGTQNWTLPLPTIHITDLGKKEGGVTTDQMISSVLSKISSEALQVAQDKISSLGKSTLNLGKDIGKTIGTNASGVLNGLGGLFQKK